MTEDDPTPTLLLDNAVFGGPTDAGECHWEILDLGDSMQPCKIPRRALHPPYYIRNFRYRSNVVA
jgi:hypothetical protein